MTTNHFAFTYRPNLQPMAVEIIAIWKGEQTPIQINKIGYRIETIPEQAACDNLPIITTIEQAENMVKDIEFADIADTQHFYNP